MINKKELETLLSKAEAIMGKKGKMADDCILSFLFFKYVNDIYKWHVKNIKQEFAGDERAIQGRISRLPLKFYEESLFDFFYANINEPNLNEIIKNGMSIFKDNGGNYAWMSSVFTPINLDYIASDYIMSLDIEVIRKLLEVFNEYDMTGKEEFDLFNTAFNYFNGWTFSFQSFRDYVVM